MTEFNWTKFQEANHAEQRAEDVAAFFGWDRDKAIQRMAEANQRLDAIWKMLGPNPKPRDLREYYGSDWWLLKRLNRKEPKWFWQTLIDWIAKLPSDGRLLEYGCGAGEYAVWAASRGMKVDALEIAGIGTEWLRWFTHRYGLSIEVHTIPTVLTVPEFEHKAYEAVAMAAVFEHTLDPIGLARKVVQYPKAGGQMYVLMGYKAGRGHLHKAIAALPEVEEILATRDDINCTIVRDTDGGVL